MVDRSQREQATRANTQRKASWKPPNLLPDPNPRDGVVYRWVRTSTLGNADATNVSTRMREGWEPVPAEDVPELQIMIDKNSRFPGNVEVGGLLLCRNSAENSDDRRRYYESVANNQIRAMDQSLMKESDPRMPLHQPNRRSTTTWGSGNR